MIDVTTRIGGLTQGYRFSGPSDVNPPKPGTYISGPGGDTAQLLISKTDADGRTLPDSIATDARSNLRMLTTFLGETSNELWDLLAITDKDTHFIVTSYWLFGGRRWPPLVDDITLFFLKGDVQDDPTRLVGKFRTRIRCNVAQYSRSFDNEYAQRYLVATNYQFQLARRNVYVRPVTGFPSGLPFDTQAVKIERVQSHHTISLMTLQTYPSRTTDPGIDVEEFEYTDIAGNNVLITVPRVI